MIRTPFLKKDQSVNKTNHRSRKFPGSIRVPGNFWEVRRTGPVVTRHGKGRKRGLACFEATFGMVIASTTLVRATPPRPGQHQARGRRSGADQPCKQMAHLGNGQGSLGGSSRRGRPGGRGRSSGAT